MLMAHPAVLRPLVEEYYALVAPRVTEGGSVDPRRLDDVCYTLCVATGTRDVAHALAAARAHLAGARPRHESLAPGPGAAPAAR